MASYTRLIEFKVKDQALRQSVDKLGKSLGCIDKSVLSLNKQFGKLFTAVKGLGKELEGVAKSTKTLNQNSKNIEIVNPKKITASLLKLKEVKKVIKELNTVGSAFGRDRRLSDDYNDHIETLKAFTREIANGTKFLAANEQGLNKQAAAFAKISAASKIASVAYKTSIEAQTKAEQKLRLSQLERIGVQERLYARQGLTPGRGLPARDQTGFLGAQGLLDQEESISDRNTIASLSLYKQELQNINRFLKIGGEEYNKVDAAINRINEKLSAASQIKTKEVTQEKEVTKKVRDKLKLQKENLKVVNQTLKVTAKISRFLSPKIGELFGVLGGKRGGISQLIAGDVSLQVIKNLIKFVPFLDQKLKKQIETWSNYGQVAARALTGVKIASSALSGVLGGTQWVTSAIKGFIDFEKAAATSIWRIQNNWTKFQGVMGAALMFGFNPFGKGGVYDIAMGGANRRENKRYAQQGGTDLQINEKGLEKMNTLLLNRNRSAKDYQRILASAVQLEKEISKETKMQSIMRDHISGKIARDMKKQDIKRKKDLRDRREERSRAFQDRAEAFEMEQAEMRGRMYMGPETQGLMAPGRQGRVRRDVWARYQRRLASRRQRRSMFNENLMLGAGFPMLFGGGLGSVAGGIAGAASNRSGKGFGAQILLSALGQQVDAFVGKTKELADAIRKPTNNLGALVQAAGLTDTPLGNQIKQLEELGLKASAAALATDALTAKIGKKGMEDLKKFSDEWLRFSNEMEVARLKLMAFVSGPLSLLAKTLNFLNEKDMKVEAQKLANKDTIAKFGPRPSMKHPLDLKGFWEMQTETIDSTAREKFRDKRQDFHFKNLVERGFSSDTDVQERIKRIQGQDTKDLRKKVELEKNRLSMSSTAFDIETKKIELARQDLEIKWQTEELDKMRNGLEKDNLKIKVEKLIATRDLTAAELENFKTLNMLDGKWRDIANTIENGVVNAIEGAIQGTKTLGEVASSVFNQIARQMISMGVNAVLSNFMPSLFPARAAGGPVSGNKSYLVGEKGPELFTPTSSGTITPNHALGGSNIVVNVDASGSSVEGDDQGSQQLGEMLAAAIQSELVKQKRPGGILS